MNHAVLSSAGFFPFFPVTLNISLFRVTVYIMAVMKLYIFLLQHLLKASTYLEIFICLTTTTGDAMEQMNYTKIHHITQLCWISKINIDSSDIKDPDFKKGIMFYKTEIFVFLNNYSSSFMTRMFKHYHLQFLSYYLSGRDWLKIENYTLAQT